MNVFKLLKVFGIIYIVIGCITSIILLIAFRNISVLLGIVFILMGIIIFFIGRNGIKRQEDIVKYGKLYHGRVIKQVTNMFWRSIDIAVTYIDEHKNVNIVMIPTWTKYQCHYPVGSTVMFYSYNGKCALQKQNPMQ